MSAFDLLEQLKIPIFWVNHTGSIGWTNTSAREQMPFLANQEHWDDIRGALPEEFIFHIHEYDSRAEGFLVECLLDTNRALAQRVQDLLESHKQLDLIFSEAFDEVYVTDGQGITLRVNKATERLYGIRAEDLVGKSVFDLEREGVFYPSVSGMALQHRKRVTVLQTTLDGKRLMTTANPVFDENGEIILVISSSKDVSDVLSMTQENRTKQEVSPSPSQTLTDVHGTLGPLSTVRSLESWESMDSLDSLDSPNQLVSRSPVFQSLLHLAHRVASTNASVLLLGETGVGKNRMAEWIHEHSPRRNAPFVDVNCAAIPASLMESELFGYESGAFTGAVRGGKTGKLEIANHGTLFLNEIGELPLELQGKLLDFIQQRTLTRVGGTRSIKVDTRVVSATNRDLAQMVQAGLFRADLFYRLNVIPMEIPPLRDRPEDIPELAEAFLSRLTESYPRFSKRLSAEVISLFTRYAWPGNVRELENLMERLVVTVEDAVLLPAHLPEELRHPVGHPLQHPLRDQGADKVSVVGNPDNVLPRHGRATVYDGGLAQEATAAPHEWSVSSLDSDSAKTGDSPLKRLEAVERDIYAEALKTYKSTYQIAEALQVSQATVVRKIRQHKLRADVL